MTRTAAKGGFSSAAVVVRVATGDVLAMAVSDDYFGKKDGQVNAATSPRPAGSTLKPFLAALAMERGIVTPETRLLDAPGSYRGYRPANFDGKYRGLVSLRDSLVMSLNIPFVRMLDEVGVPEFADELRTLGFSGVAEPDDSRGLGMAIGSVEVSLLELVRAYACLARGGDGLFSPGTSYLVADMLSGAERAQAALGHVADVETSRFAWKTGTSSAYRDAWTVAWNPEYAAADAGAEAWRRAAAPVAWTIARLLYPRNDGPWFAVPPDVATRRICRETGLPASPDCPETEEGRFVRGRSSPRLCDVHRRGPDGRPAPRSARELSLVKPEEGARFRLVPGTLDQRIVCQVGEVAPDTRLWWFVDGAPAGESTGRAPFAAAMTAGAHVVSCATSDGSAASVSISVEE